jgi:hypothetical protein
MNTTNTMNTPLKFDHDKFDHDKFDHDKFDHEKRPNPNLQFEDSHLRAHHEDLAVHTLASIGRHGGLIASLVALVLTLMIIPLIPRKYSAEALIYPNLFS